MRALLDVNVLIALFDRDHPMSDRVADWFSDNAASGWASCAVTQNGYLRIVSQATYPHAIALGNAFALLARACAHPSHAFWPCDISVTDPDHVRREHILRSSQLTDTYLLALAVKHGGRFVTLDRRITPASVSGATGTNLLVL